MSLAGIEHTSTESPFSSYSSASKRSNNAKTEQKHTKFNQENKHFEKVTNHKLKNSNNWFFFFTFLNFAGKQLLNLQLFFFFQSAPEGLNLTGI